jgi:hypothetical protein
MTYGTIFVICAVIYFVGCVFHIGLLTPAYNLGKIEDDGMFFFIIAWPVVWPFLLVVAILYYPCLWIYKLGEWVGKW